MELLQDEDLNTIDHGSAEGELSIGLYYLILTMLSGA